MNPQAGSQRSRIGFSISELLFSLYLCLGIMTILTSFDDAIMKPLESLELRVKGMLHLRQTDLIEGHFAIWIPTLLLSSIVLAFLRAARNAVVVQKTLPALAGVFILLVAPSVWLAYPRYVSFWPVWACVGFGTGFIANWLPSRMGVVFICATSFYVLWHAFTRVGDYPGYGGPAGVILGFSSAASWTFYAVRSWTTRPD